MRVAKRVQGNAMVVCGRWRVFPLQLLCFRDTAHQLAVGILQSNNDPVRTGRYLDRMQSDRRSQLLTFLFNADRIVVPDGY